MKKIAVLIPCYNESITIRKVVQDYRAVLPEADIYVYDNNSTDGTDRIAREAGAIVRYEYRQGKGNVIRSMFRDIDADCYIMIDGDDTYPAEHARQMADLVLKKGVDMVIGDSYKYDTYNMGWNGDYDDPMTFMELWNTESGYAKFMGGYSNAEFDEMFDSLSLMTDTAERTEVYKEMEQNLVAENAGMAPLYYGNSQFFVQEYVKNLSTPNFGAALEFSRAYISGKE